MRFLRYFRFYPLRTGGILLRKIPPGPTARPASGGPPIGLKPPAALRAAAYNHQPFVHFRASLILRQSRKISWEFFFLEHPLHK
jgi:hypothetical protein